MRSLAQTVAGHPPMSPRTPRIRCRPVEDADIPAVVNLLAGGFRYSRKSWQRAFARLAQHATPAGYPRYGYLLESAGMAVGVMPMIFSAITAEGATTIRCSVSNWYVLPAFRAYAALLASHALRHREVTYFVITPAPHTLALLEVQGYMRYCSGRFVAIPALAGGAEPVRIVPVTAAAPAADGLGAAEAALLQSHAQMGCYSLVCHAGGQAHPFVFATRRKFGVVPFAALIYCRELGDFVRFAGPLGRFLACRFYPLVVIDADGPVDGLVGRYADGYPKYFKGPDRPRLGDLAYSKRVFFGI